MAEREIRKLKSPDGTEITLTDLPDDPSVVLAAAATNTVPEIIFGFVVRTGIGPYPPDAPTSHRKAFYVTLDPVEEQARTLCEKLNRERVLGMTPLTPDGTQEILQNPQGAIAEQTAKDTLAAAIREIRSHL